jgi:hypothetical protein
MNGLKFTGRSGAPEKAWRSAKGRARLDGIRVGEKNAKEAMAKILGYLQIIIKEQGIGRATQSLHAIVKEIKRGKRLQRNEPPAPR